MKQFLVFSLFFVFALSGGSRLSGGEEVVLFDGTDLEQWTMGDPEGWVIEEGGVLTCQMKEAVDKKGRTKTVGRGYLWSRKVYGDFVLKLEYRLSEGANSGVFYRTDPNNPVHGGFEIQLMDNEGFQKTHGKKDARKLNGSFYDAKAPSANPAKPVGEWNSLELICEGPRIRLKINGVETFDVDVEDWDTAGSNPDGTTNKFKSALKDLPREGHLGLQNHGQKVWFRNISIVSAGN